MFEKLHGIWVSPTDGMPCEWNNPCGRKSVYHLNDGEINVWNLCTQHAKTAMRRQTGQRVMAEDLGHAVKRERKQIALALEYYWAGWHDALKSEEALY